MKRLILIICSIFVFYGCSRYNTPKEKFESLQNSDFSDFVDVGIVFRPPVYFVRFHDTTYIVRKNFLSSRIKSITNYDNQPVNFNGEDKKYLEYLLNLFDKLDVMAMSVDKKGNVFFSFNRKRCTYSYLKLSTAGSLDECGLQYYKRYNENWYYNVECSK